MTPTSLIDQNSELGHSIRLVLRFITMSWAAIYTQVPHHPGWMGSVTLWLSIATVMVDGLTNGTPLGDTPNVNLPPQDSEAP